MDEYSKIDDTTMKITTPVETTVTITELKNQIVKLKEMRDYHQGLVDNANAEIEKVQVKITEAGKLGITENVAAEPTPEVIP